MKIVDFLVCFGLAFLVALSIILLVEHTENQFEDRCKALQSIDG